MEERVCVGYQNKNETLHRKFEWRIIMVCNIVVYWREMCSVMK